jgi:hypothetical protein
MSAETELNSSIREKKMEFEGGRFLPAPNEKYFLVN